MAPARSNEDPAPLELLRRLFPGATSLTAAHCEWVTLFRQQHPAAYDALFTGDTNRPSYRDAPEPRAVEAALDFYSATARQAFQRPGKFEDGFLAHLLGQLSPHLKVLGHHYDDVVRVLQRLFTREERWPALYANQPRDKSRYQALEAVNNLEILPGRPPGEVGVCLALALATAYVVEGLTRKTKVPWIFRTALKAAGVFPFFNHIIRGELAEALKEAKRGKWDEMIHWVMIAALSIAGVLMRSGKEEVAAGTMMASILSVIDGYSTDAVERSRAAANRHVGLLPRTARVVGADGRVQGQKSETLIEGQIIELRHDEVAPVDVKIEAILSGQHAILADPNLTRGQSSQRYVAGSHLDQGSLILDEGVVLHARVTRKHASSSVVRQARRQDNLRPSEHESRIERLGNKWIWGMLGGTLLAALSNVLGPLARGVGIDFAQVLEKSTAFATLSAPCNILVSAMIEGAVLRKLWSEGIPAPNGNPLERAAKVDAYCLDFTGTCTTGPEVSGMTFLDAAGTRVGEERARELFRQVALVGLASESQHAKQVGMRIALYKEVPAVDAKQLAHDFACPGGEERGRGVTGTYAGVPIRVGRRDYVGLSAAEAAHLGTHAEDEESLTYVRVGEQIGVIHFRDQLRPGMRETLRALGPERIHILSGDETNRGFILQTAREMGIPAEQVKTGLSSEQKATEIRRLQEAGLKVAMIGDGANDAIPLAQADVRYGMNDTADDAILSVLDFKIAGLASVVPMEKLARKVTLISRATLGFALLYTALTSVAQLWPKSKWKLGVVSSAFAHEGMSGLIALVHEKWSGWLVRQFAKERDQVFCATPA